MKIEHVGYMVQDPVAVANWYCQNLGFEVARKVEGSPYTHFLKDSAGDGMVEIYNNPAAQVPDYRSIDALVLHLALSVTSEPIEQVRDRLLAAGATIDKDLVETPAGDRLVMLRDPWGFAVQLCWRKEPMM